MIFSEILIKEVCAATTAKSQTGDVSQHLLEQGFFDNGNIPEGLKNRNKQLSGGNPIDVKKDFDKQQIN